MITFNTTYDALINHLLSATITDITADDIAFENMSFDPSGKTAWLDTFYLPADLSTTSKTTTGQQESGILQVSVYVPQNDETGGSRQYAARLNQIASDVLTAFTTNTQTVYNDVTVSILDASLQPARKSGGWYVKDISINYIRIGE